MRIQSRQKLRLTVWSRRRGPTMSTGQQRGSEKPFGVRSSVIERLTVDSYQILTACSSNVFPEAEGPRLNPEITCRGLRAFSHLINGSQDLKIAGTRLRDFFPRDREPSENPLVARDPMERMFRYLRTRRLIVTQEGSVGLAPIEAQHDDLIYLIPGCNIPIVLRPSSNSCFQIVGGCYLHGSMEGEAAEFLRSESS